MRWGVGGVQAILQSTLACCIGLQLEGLSNMHWKVGASCAQSGKEGGAAQQRPQRILGSCVQERCSTAEGGVPLSQGAGPLEGGRVAATNSGQLQRAVPHGMRVTL